MLLQIHVQDGPVFCTKAQEMKLSPEALGEKIINTYTDCLHKLQYSDLKRGYTESGEVNLLLAGLF